MLFNEMDLISVYTRAQAIEDGVLVDVSTVAREANFKIPVAVTRRLWDEYITPSPESIECSGQSEQGRLWDVLNMLFFTIRLHPGDSSPTIFYKLYFIMKARQRRLITLKSICGPGDNGEPVITIMLPDED